MARFGLVIDVDRCTGCGACAVACSVENNVPAVPPQADERKGLTWIRLWPAGDGAAGKAVIPVPCQQCGEHPPCLSVCPQNAVQVDEETGIVGQVPARCLGCRYCMAACPYHARAFNWWDPSWPDGMEGSLNPDVAPRMRGTVEKCNLCHGRMQAARALAAARGTEGIAVEAWTPACVEACPAGAIVFGDLEDREDEPARLAEGPRAFRLLPSLKTDPGVVYLSSRDWVRRLGETALEREGKEAARA